MFKLFNWFKKPNKPERKEVVDLIYRLKLRAQIRRRIVTRKSVQEGKPDRIADLLDESATMIAKLYNEDLKNDYGL